MRPYDASAVQLPAKRDTHSAATDGALVWDRSAQAAQVSKAGAWATLPDTGGLLATGPLGYATGTGGTVTQATSKTTAVTLDKLAGAVTMNGAALASGASAEFTVNNSLVAAADVPVIAVASPSGRYRAEVSAVAAGSFQLRVTNVTALSRSDAVVLNVIVLKGATA